MKTPPLNDSAADNLERIWLDSLNRTAMEHELAVFTLEHNRYAILFFDVDRSIALRSVSVDLKVRCLSQLVEFVRDRFLGSNARIWGHGTRDDILVAVPVAADADHEAIKTLADGVRRAIEEEFKFGDADSLISLTVSGGVSVFPDHTSDPLVALWLAEGECRRSKEAGRNLCTFFEGRLESLKLVLPDTELNSIPQPSEHLLESAKMLLGAVDLVLERHSGLERFTDGGENFFTRCWPASESAARWPWTIAVIGPPGVGKSTLAAALRAQIGARSFAVRLRVEHLRATRHPLAMQIDAALQSGPGFIPDALVGAVLEDFLRDPSVKAPLILEGLPINLNQAWAVLNLLKNVGRALDLIIFLDAPSELLAERVVTRLVCARCELKAQAGCPQDKDAAACGTCGGPITRRVDDAVSRFSARMDAYRKQRELIEVVYRGLPSLHFDTSSTGPTELCDIVLRALQELQ